MSASHAGDTALARSMQYVVATVRFARRDDAKHVGIGAGADFVAYRELVSYALVDGELVENRRSA